MRKVYVILGVEEGVVKVLGVVGRQQDATEVTDGFMQSFASYAWAVETQYDDPGPEFDE